MFRAKAERPNCLRHVNLLELAGTPGDSADFNYFECTTVCERQTETQEYLEHRREIMRAPNLVASSSWTLGSDWPDATISIDLTSVDLWHAQERILRWLAELKEQDVLFAVLPSQPPMLLCELNQRGIEWIGNSVDGDQFRLFIRGR